MLNEQYFQSWSEQWSSWMKALPVQPLQEATPEMPDMQKWQEECRHQMESCQQMAGLLQEGAQTLLKDQACMVQQSLQKSGEYLKQCGTGAVGWDKVLSHWQEHSETLLDSACETMNKAHHIGQEVVKTLKKNVQKCADSAVACESVGKKKKAV